VRVRIAANAAATTRMKLSDKARPPDPDDVEEVVEVAVGERAKEERV